MIKIDLSGGKKPKFPGTRPWYDTKEGIAKAITSLEGLNNLASERHTAGYDRDEHLNQFYILNGRYFTDACGNLCTVFGVPSSILPSSIPPVLTQEEFFKFLEEQAGKNHSLCHTLDGGNLPRTDLLCSHCRKGWDISNCHDVFIVRETRVISLADFVGKTLGEVKLTHTERVDAIYFMQPDILIRNDRFIDLSPKYPNPEHDWQKKFVKNERGWVSERDGIDDSYVIQEGDEGYFNVWSYFHSDCHLKSVAENPEFLGKDGNFKNLAGAAYADIIIKKELKEAGIEIVRGDKTQGEVPLTLTGKLGTFTFVRAWTYWMVDCKMPLDVAEEMYKDEIGAKFVRVAGHCGCPPPEEWAFPRSEDLKKGLEELGIKSVTYGELADILNSGKIDAPRFVESYHIDTMPGLKLFVETVKKHGLA
jgi:hypothetical protein